MCFSSSEEATKAAREMNGRTLVNKPLYVALAQPKEERQAHLDAVRMQRLARGMPQGQVPMYQHPYYMHSMQVRTAGIPLIIKRVGLPYQWLSVSQSQDTIDGLFYEHMFVI